jgi:hypothetical protein
VTGRGKQSGSEVCALGEACAVDPFSALSATVCFRARLCVYVRGPVCVCVCGCGGWVDRWMEQMMETDERGSLVRETDERKRCTVQGMREVVGSHSP